MKHSSSDASQNTASTSAGLYGLYNSNRSGAELWGKNQFNSSFPAALACYMRDKGQRAVYLTLDADLRITSSEVSFDEVFNSNRPNRDLRFEFESTFKPYAAYVLDDIGPIDLVVAHNEDDDANRWRRPLEVKLTVIPDDKTACLMEKNWSAELVIRPASTKYCAVGMYHSARNSSHEIREIFQKVCGNFHHWDSEYELREKRKDLINCLNRFQTEFRHLQQPFLMQPIWKTIGKSPALADDAFDIFIWSDYALCRAFIERAIGADRKINRFCRASARLARVLHQLASQGKAHLATIYTEMTYKLQTDKEFALSAHMTKQHLNSPRRIRPALKRDIVAEIILNGGEKLLSPERRFDATVYFTARSLFGRGTD